MPKITNSDISLQDDIEDSKVRIARMEEVQKSFNGKLDYVKEDISEIKADVKDFSNGFNEYKLKTSENRIIVKSSLDSIDKALCDLTKAKIQEEKIKKEITVNRIKLKDKVIYGSFGIGATTLIGYIAKLAFGF